MYRDVVRVEDFGHLTNLAGIQVTNHDSWGARFPQLSFLDLLDSCTLILGPRPSLQHSGSHIRARAYPS